MIKTLRMLVISMVFLVGTSLLADWETYVGDVLPSEAGFGRTNYNGPYGGDTTEIFSIIDDPAIMGNSLVKVFSDTSDAGHKEQWKYEYGGADSTGITLVWRAMVTDTSFMERGLNVYLYTGGYYDQVTSRNSSKNIKFEKNGSFSDEFDATQWHIYRMTVKGDSVAMYLDEETVPFLAGKTGSTSGSKYFRFGDSGGQTYGALYDWFAWDTTGAYNPSEGEILPSYLTGLPGRFTEGTWEVYDGSVLPSFAGFERTNYNGPYGGDTTEIFSIIDDSDISGNSLVKVFSDTANAGHKEQWKFNYGGDNETGHTLVWRAAVTDTAFMERGLNVYLYTGNYYDQITTRNSSKNLKFEKVGTFTEEFDATQFHVYRMTVIGDSVALYLDENPVPFLAGKTGSTSGSKYFRFGDSGGQTYGALYDWFIWDDTGAFSPEQKPVPRSLSGVATELTVDNHSVNVPNEFALSQNYPNPFNPTTQIMFKIGEAGNVKMNIYDIRGRLVQTLVNEHKPAGVHTVKWNGRNQFGNLVSTGIYFYNIEMGSYRETKRMLLMK